MSVLPSTTGNDPIIEQDAEVQSESTADTDMKSLTRRTTTQGYSDEDFPQRLNKESRKLTRKATVSKRKSAKDQVRPPSLWTVYCTVITFWAPNAVLKCFGKVSKDQQRAWREKIGLVSIILCMCAIVGFITFGFTQAVCGAPTLRMEAGNVSSSHVIIHGTAYNLEGSHHPPAVGIPRPPGKKGANILYDLPVKYGGMDLSFMFQNVNGHCKGLITLQEGSDVPTNADKDLAWYFPCVPHNQHGTDKWNSTDEPPYLGYACHTSAKARNGFYSLKPAGDVYFTWDQLKKNKSHKLTVYSGNVLDLSLLNWFNSSQVKVPSTFKAIQNDPRVLGVDITHWYQAPEQKKLARCLSEITKVGSVDTETVGCIASKVVLYVSLVFIVSVVLIKFCLALFFGWFLSWKLGAARTKISPEEQKKRRNQIEEWSDDIYRPPPALRDVNAAGHRGSFLPTKSRFTSPYAGEVAAKRGPTTFASQTSTSRLVPPNTLYNLGSNGSQGSLNGASAPPNGSSSNLLSPTAGGDPRLSQYYEGSATSGGFIHELAVPQPPADYQPYHLPLAHTICLITCYSEDESGIRTTLDSIATTDYPNSHKVMLIICDGMITGANQDRTTPEICLDMMKDPLIEPELVQAYSYVAVAQGSKRHNMAKVYAGFYDYGKNSAIPVEKQQRVPMIVLVKSGTPDEQGSRKAGNRGKRDSQIILMSFLQKVMFDERMTELEFELFNGIWRVTGVSPDFYETVLMVDADTKVFPDSLTHMNAAMVHDPQVMGLCGETKIANKRQSWVSMIQVFE